MSYPESPFGDDFHTEALWVVGDDQQTTVNELTWGISKNGNTDRAFTTNSNEILNWLCTPPEVTTFRVNLLKTNTETVLGRIKKHLQESNCGNFICEQYSLGEDIIIIKHPIVNENNNLKKYQKEVIVDPICGAALLRGAHIYAPGVMAMITGTHIGDAVSVYVDLEKGCRKGLTKNYEGKKIFIGNGVVKMERCQLFCEKPQKGIAVRMTETISNCPPCLGDDFIPLGEALLQNLPSILCIYVLDPQPGDVILDMCASPGNKTTHIASLSQNKAKLVAIDKIPSKVKQLKQRCDNFGADVEIIQADSTKLIEEGRFCCETFDRILLDAPCSALGKRPQFVNTITRKVLQSYVPLQRKLFETAVKLLKYDGILVYSTCTITLAENEGIVGWALKNFDIELVEVKPVLGGFGLKGTSLTEEDLKKVQRFGPNQKIDSVGFFIAKFVKRPKNQST